MESRMLPDMGRTTVVGIIVVLMVALGHAYTPPVEEYVESGTVRVGFGSQRVLVDQTQWRGCQGDASLPWVGGGTVHFPWQPYSLRASIGSLLVTRSVSYGGLQGTCDALVSCCNPSPQAVTIPIRAIGAVHATIGLGQDPASIGCCGVNFGDGAHMLHRLVDPWPNKPGTACVVGPTAWVHPVAFPKSAQDAPVVIGVTVGPSATRLRSGGFQGAVRLIVYDPDNPDRRQYFFGPNLTLTANWDGQVFTYLPAQGEDIPDIDEGPFYITASRYGMILEVFTQDEVFATRTDPNAATVYANNRFSFDYHASPHDPSGSVNLVVFTPLD